MLPVCYLVMGWFLYCFFPFCVLFFLLQLFSSSRNFFFFLYFYRLDFVFIFLSHSFKIPFSSSFLVLSLIFSSFLLSSFSSLIDLKLTAAHACSRARHSPVSNPRPCVRLLVSFITCSSYFLGFLCLLNFPFHFAS